MDPFSDFWNADLTIIRAEGSRGADGYTESGTTTVLGAVRCDAQDQGRTLQSPDETHEGGSLACHSVDGDVSSVESGDKATVAFDDGRQIEGHVAAVTPLDDSLTIARD
jgi:hypothetical protein